MTKAKTVTEFLESEQDYFAMTIGDIHDYRRLLIVFELARHSVELKKSIDMTHPSCLSRHQEKVVEFCQKTISKIEGKQ